ncbi:MAG: hypothetical protein DRR16_10970 [Candidatus Parabeggiatoa sp. nov. 3]|nr:MAG: hypothetical protein DRR00_16255 [Gammaproteobacteria bacterium]RKZ57406.1 MAG: hypothetical protein DRQ99_27005 [Gammaproteobacteria bacterium]RKZ85919.1 MAG: hypothetical protein DRR16_10970 [Gammaproteobacteria bacterium]
MTRKDAPYPDGLELIKGNEGISYKCWSIGLYQGKSLETLKPLSCQPIISTSSIAEEPTAFVADPFYVNWSGMHLLYFELYSWKTKRGVIGVAKSDNLLRWEYSGIVLSESFHLSYPHIFVHNGDLYMLPETIGAGCMRLYKAHHYDKFELIHEFILGSWGDSTLIFRDNLWWLFTCPDPFTNSALELFYSTDIKGIWNRHPLSPIVSNNKNKARPAGRLLEHSGSLYRFAQDCKESYGRAIRCYEINNLNTREYSEQATTIDDTPILDGRDSEWATLGIHHIDVIRHDHRGWLCVVDGASKKRLTT